MTTLATTIVLDPPWWETGGGKSKRGADKHYPLVKTRDMTTTIARSPLWTPDPAGCSVWMWATANPDAFFVLEALGATYVTNTVWLKGSEVEICTAFPLKGNPMLFDRFIKIAPPGLGQRFRFVHEHLLYARIGTVAVPPKERRGRSVFVAKRGKHSAKPEEAYELIERHDPPGRRHELFARTQRPGWHVWGNEVHDV